MTLADFLYLQRYTFSVGLIASVIVSVLVPLSESTGISVSDLNAGKCSSQSWKLESLPS